MEAALAVAEQKLPATAIVTRRLDLRQVEILREENVHVAVAVEVRKHRAVPRRDLRDALERLEGEFPVVVDENAGLEFVDLVFLGGFQLFRRYRCPPAMEALAKPSNGWIVPNFSLI